MENIIANKTAILNNQKIIEIARRAYTFGYPLVLMNQTKLVSTENIEIATPMGKAPVNKMARVRKFPNYKFTDVVKPNVDTFYTVAWMDLGNEPLVLEVPVTNKKYYLLPFLDAYSNVFESIGQRIGVTNGAKYLITGPKWDKVIPEGLEHLIPLKSTTDIVWMLGRIEVDNNEEEIWGLQNKFKLKTLTEYRNPTTPSAPIVFDKITAVEDTIATIVAEKDSLSPVEAVREIGINDFFNNMMQLMVDNPPAPADEKIVAEMASIGIVPTKEGTFDYMTLSTEKEVQDKLLNIPTFSENAWIKMETTGTPMIIKGEIIDKRNSTEVDTNGWFDQVIGKGTYGTNYTQRAYQAYTGLGANLPEDAVYPNITTETNGTNLNGQNKYTIRFEADQLPPVKGFWSLTAYNNRNLLVYNDINRYALGSNSDLHFDSDDGSLTIYVQAQKPVEQHKKSNWLPIPSNPLASQSNADNSDFSLTLRLYWPEPSVTDLTWVPPPVINVS